MVIAAILALTRIFKLTTSFGSIYQFYVNCLPPGYKLGQMKCTLVTVKLGGGGITLKFKVARCVSQAFLLGNQAAPHCM